MKTQIMNPKNLALVIAAVASLTGATPAHARLCGYSFKQAVGSGSAPKPNQAEGTEESLSPETVNELTDWALNSKQNLEDLLSKIEPLTMVEKKQMLVECIDNAVEDSKPLTTETLLRYTLNRAKAANDAIEEEAIYKNLGVVAAGTIDQQVRLLRESVKMALNYYQNDIEYINGKKKSTDIRTLVTPEFADFGVKYNDLILKLSSSIYDATAQYKILRSSVGWLAVDLSKDANKQAFGRISISLNSTHNISLPDPANVNLADSTAVIKSRVAKKAIMDARRQIESVKADLAKARMTSAQ